MLVKTITRKDTSYRQLLRYLTRPSDHEVLAQYNLLGTSIDDWAEQYQRNEQRRLTKRVKGRSNTLVHHILSFHEDSTGSLNTGILKHLTDEYVRLRGIDTVGLAVVHKERNHVHVHLCESAVKLDGRCNRQSKADYALTKEALQDYQKRRFPELNASIVDHGRGTSKSINAGLKKSHKEVISEILQQSIHSKQTLVSLSESLQSQGFIIYNRGGQPAGISPIDGKGPRYRFRRLGIARKDIIQLCEKQRYIDALNRARALSREATRER